MTRSNAKESCFKRSRMSLEALQMPPKASGFAMRSLIAAFADIAGVD